MQVIREGNKTDYIFNNVTDFERMLEANKERPSINRILTRGEFEFFQTNDWEEFEDYIKVGNKDITADLKKQTQLYIDKFQSEIVESSAYQFDVVGEFFDIGAVMTGEPEAWIKEIKIEDDKFITLDIQGVYSDGTDLHMVRQNGAKVFAMASVLEQQGFLVRINMHYSVRGSNSRGSRFSAEVKVKDHDDTLDYKKFGILLGVAFFRRGILRLLEIEYGHNLKGSFGAPTSGVEGEIRLDAYKDIEKLEQKLKEA